MKILPRRGVHTWTLARSLAIGFGLVLAVSVSIVLVFSVSSGVATTFELLSERAVLLVSSIELQTREHLAPAQEQARTIGARITAGELDPNDEAAIAEALQNSLAPARQIGASFFVPPDLERVIEVYRDGDRMGTRIENWAGNAVAERGMLALRRGGGGRWGQPTFDIDTSETVLNFRQPVRRDGQLLGAIVTTVTISELSEYLQDLVHGLQVNAFILVGREQVLALTSTALAAPKYRAAFGLSQVKPLPWLGEVPDPVLRRIWDPDSKPLGNLKQFDGFSAHRIEVDDSEHVFFLATRDDIGAQPWTIGVHLRTQSILSSFRRLFKASFAGLVILGLALLGVFWLGRRLAMPVLRLADAAKQVASHGPSAVSPLPNSRIHEINDASLAFNQMVEGLKERERIRETFGRYVPGELVDKLIGDRGVLGPQSRETTTLFTDIVGFSTVSEKMTPSGLIGMLNEYFAVVAGPIEAHGGVIHQFQGDAILATFNSPNDLQDHQAHAISAALEIQALVLNERFANGVELATRIGINTGEAVCGTVGSGSRLGFTVHGDEVNLAARLEQMNKELGTRVLVSGATVAAVRDRFEFTRVGVLPVRGRTQPVIVYRVKGPHTAQEAAAPELEASAMRSV